MLHYVDHTNPFLLSRFEVTQQEWRTVMGTAPSHFADCGPRCPVENVTFFDVQQFLAKLNERSGQGGPGGQGGPKDPPLRYRLPTAAQWDVAGRPAPTGPYSTRQ